MRTAVAVTETPVVDAAVRPGRNGDRLWVAVAAVAGLFLVGFIIFVIARHHHPKPVSYPVSPPATLTVGSVAPAFTLPRLGGGTAVSLSGARGTPTIVNFFASWCRNCQAELAAFAQVSARAHGKLAIIGVDSNDADTAKAQSLLAGARATYPVAIDGAARVATAYLLAALPVTYFLDAQGRVVHVAFGAQTLRSLNHWADALTAKAGPS
jgi:peroxiredoxin